MPVSKLSLKLKILRFQDSHGSAEFFTDTEAHPVKKMQNIAIAGIKYALKAIFLVAVKIKLNPICKQHALTYFLTDVSSADLPSAALLYRN
jgi:hypothetical protein